jgi:ketosteroid isomerase-like protein
MDAIENKRTMTAVFAELERGNPLPFRDTLADDCVWHMIGTTAWSGTYRGKPAILGKLLQPLRTQFADQYTSAATRIVADGDVVVIECRGRVTTRTGRPYSNTYCFVCRLEGGKVKELTEYMDTQLVVDVLEPPPAGTGAGAAAGV